MAETEQGESQSDLIAERQRGDLRSSVGRGSSQGSGITDVLVHPLVAGLWEGIVNRPGPQWSLDADVAPRPVDAGTVGTFGVAAGSEQVRVFVGLLGGRVKRDNNELWRVLFYDSNLSDWLLVLENDVVYARRVNDRTAPEGLRDYVWVKADGKVAHGNANRSPEALFLSGDFIRAGDFTTTLRGDTFSSASGLLCEATTPGCCGGKSR